MNWDKKSIGAIFVCIVLFTVYMSYLQRKYPDYYAGRGKETVETSPAPVAPLPAPVEAPSTASSSEGATLDAPAVASLSPEQLKFETKTRVLEFDQDTAAIKSIRLIDYLKDRDGKESAELLDSPLTIQASVNPSDHAIKRGYAAQRDGNRLSFTRREGNWEVVHTYTIPGEGYGLELQTQFKNLGGQAQDLKAGFVMHESLTLPSNGGGFMASLMPATAAVQSLAYGIAGDQHSVLVREICDDPKDALEDVLTNVEQLDFFGVDKHYFLEFLWAKGQPLRYEVHRSAPLQGEICPLTFVGYQNFGSVAAGASADLKLNGYFGPKQLELLKAEDPALESGLNLGWFSFFARPLLFSLKALYAVFHNYGIAIILITLLLKMAFYPLTRAAAISMKKMQKLQPEMNRLREKYKADPQRQQRELMAFMGQHKVNPLKGCLPILPQIPVFVAFYNVLSQSIELRHAPFYGWLTDLAARDPYYVTPILLGVGMFLQQKLTPNPGMDKNQEKIMLMMPVIFTVMMLSLPAGMVIYMMTNTIVSILQQQWLNKRLAITLS